MYGRTCGDLRIHPCPFQRQPDATEYPQPEGDRCEADGAERIKFQRGPDLDTQPNDQKEIREEVEHAQRSLQRKRIIIPDGLYGCLLYTSPSPRDRTRSRMPSSA